MPVVGYGLYQMDEEEAERSTAVALSCGYRHLDSASFYGNEAGVGRAIAASSIPREELFIASKVWTDCIGLGAHAVRHSVEVSLERLQVDFLDLVYVHWPVPGKHVEAYKALEALVAEGKARGIGLSNYRVADYEELVASGITLAPLVNQIEVNPFLYRRDAIDFFQDKGMAIVGYKPLLRGKAVTDATAIEVARKHNVTPAQVLLRWGIQHKFAVLPKSSQAERIDSNLHLFHFHLDDGDMATLDSLTTKDSLANFEAHFTKRSVADPSCPTLGDYAPVPGGGGGAEEAAVAAAQSGR
eukprot:CAMPEP_0118961674 /NCGR_PEP_ID=MMETSP1173-20130426/281_1 /TAXON_ID=1034831 /ORGANISM="Rhizochromulina marina cf, Strain CCMP1243" /LENGTH=298 /DNA_ID=CAMNT_0006909859 /DNA_START=72 /DNA_END=968 /DNA_ORIENTATION=+